MGLSGQQRKQLQSALIDAFPTTAFLERMLAFELDKNLRAIAGEGSLQDIVFKLIQTAEAEGWVEDLVRGACQSKPGNSRLKIIVEGLPNSAPETPPNIPQKQDEIQAEIKTKLKQKILLLVALPGRERFHEEINQIKQANRQYFFKIIIKNPVNYPDFDKAIGEECPRIVHIFGQSNRDGFLVLKDDKGNDEAVSPKDLAKIFKSHTNYVNCVLFTSSYSSASADYSSASANYSSKAAKLTSENINYAIGMKQAIENNPGGMMKQAIENNKAAIVAFVQGFYRAIALKKLNNQDVIQGAFDTGLCTIKQLIEQQKIHNAPIPVYDPIPVKKKRSQTKYYLKLIQNYQRYETEGLSSDCTLELPEVFVPLKIVATSQKNARSELIKPVTNGVNNEREYQIWDFLVATVDKQTQRGIVVLGGPGAGKSTLLRHLTIIYACEEQHKYEPKAPELIPVLLLIRDVYQEIVNKRISLVNLINEKLEQIIKENEIIPIVSRWLLEELEREEGNKCLIMLDGLDEVADETQRRQVSAWVDNQIQEYPNTAFILTSRPGGYKAAPLKNARITLEVQPFKLDQVRDFIHKWYLATEKQRNPTYDSSENEREIVKKQADDLINRIRNSSPLAAMAVNPLLLTMISMVHHQLHFQDRSLPEKRVELYKEMCEVLLEKRQEDKGIPDTLMVKDKRSVLQVLALKLMQQTTSEFQLTDGISWIQKPLATKVRNEVTPEKFIEYIRDVSGLLVEKELKYYQFAHLSFQEYLAAAQIIELRQENLLISQINESWWKETIRLYAAQSDVSNLIKKFLAIPSPSVDVMALAYDCLEESLRVNENVKNELIKKLEDGLESTDPEIFKLAVQVRLIRRDRNFRRISEELELEIDNSYITCAEYQLFLDETGKLCQPQHWQGKRFTHGDAKKTITGISWENALRFCAWLGEWYRTRLGNKLGEMVVHYRLPEKEEIKQYPINDDRQFSESVIRLVKFQLSSKYSKLADYLWSGEWFEADEETASIMLQVAGRKREGYLNKQAIENFPCDDLRRIDFLWVYASKGHFGFSVQKNIYQSLEDTSEYNEKVWNDFGDDIGWRVKENWKHYAQLAFDTRSPKGHLPAKLRCYNSQDWVEEHLWMEKDGRSVLFSRIQTCKV